MDIAGVDEDDVARAIHVCRVIDLEDTFSGQVQKDLKVIVKVVLNELDLIDKHLDVFDLRVFDDFNTTTFHIQKNRKKMRKLSYLKNASLSI